MSFREREKERETDTFYLRLSSQIGLKDDCPTHLSWSWYWFVAMFSEALIEQFILVIMWYSVGWRQVPIHLSEYLMKLFNNCNMYYNYSTCTFKNFLVMISPVMYVSLYLWLMFSAIDKCYHVKMIFMTALVTTHFF